MKKESKIFKAFRYLFISFVFVIGLIAIIGTGGCGGGSSSGGGGGGSDGSTSLATGEFTKTVTLASNIGWTSPFRAANRHLQQLYLASDINGAGYIQSIELRLNTATAGCNCPDATIKIGHTSLGVLTNTFADNVEQGKGTLETVRTGAFSVPAGSAGDYFTIILDTPFLYNGVDNLVVKFLVTACDDDITLWVDNTTALVHRMLHRFDLTATTGDLYMYVLHTRFNFEGGVNPLEFAASPGIGNSFPFGNSYNKVQLLYDATVINGSGPITGIAMRTGTFAVTTEESYTYTMRVGHSTLTDLTTDFNGNFSGTPVTVADNAPFKVPADVPTGNYIWIPMPDGSFNYNGSDNLIVEIDVSASSGTTLWSSITTSNQTRASGNSGSAIANDGVDTSQYDIRFRFNGGTMDNLTLANFNTAPPFSTIYSGRQYLYTASELGTKATITKVALRLSSAPSTAADYSNFTITMGHTSLTELTDVFANNMDDATQVYNGTFGMPAGLIVGDWIEMALDSPFIYNGTGNLVVSFESDGGSTAQYVDIGTSATLYPNRVLRLPADTLDDYLADIRFWVQ
jgi:hypothetical protein